MPALPSFVRRSTALLLVAALALAPSCRSQTPAGTYLGTEPRGALVLLDGEEIGFVTPCIVHLDEGNDHTIGFELPGYQPVTVELEPASRWTLLPWWAGANSKYNLVFPLFQPWYTFVAPIRTDGSLSPSRIFVRLEPDA